MLFDGYDGSIVDVAAAVFGRGYLMEMVATLLLMLPLPLFGVLFDGDDGSVIVVVVVVVFGVI